MRRLWIRLLTVTAVALVVPGIPAVAHGQPLGMGLPGVTVEVKGTNYATQTDLDGRFRMELPAGIHEIAVALEGYEAKRIRLAVVERQPTTVDVTLGIARYSEVVMVTADAIAAATSTSEAQLLERKRAPVITDNLGGQEMKANADSNAASALQRVTGLSVVDNQFVFVRGLGERYSNTTLSGAADSLDRTGAQGRVARHVPGGLLDSVSVVKSYTPGSSGGVRRRPGRDRSVAKLPARPLLDLSYSAGVNGPTFGPGRFSITRRRHGLARAWTTARATAGRDPGPRIIRGGIFTPELGVDRAGTRATGRSLREPLGARDGRGARECRGARRIGDRWGGFGLLGSVTQSYRNQYQEEEQNYYRVEGTAALTPFSEYDYRARRTRRRWRAWSGAAQFTPQHRVVVPGLLHQQVGERETRTFEGFNATPAATCATRACCGRRRACASAS
jgi:hypothetical protein